MLQTRRTYALKLVGQVVLVPKKCLELLERVGVLSYLELTYRARHYLHAITFQYSERHGGDCTKGLERTRDRETRDKAMSRMECLYIPGISEVASTALECPAIRAIDRPERATLFASTSRIHTFLAVRSQSYSS